MGKRIEDGTMPPRSRYPWDEWTDGSVWEIRHGEDFTLPAARLQIQMHMQARKRGLKVTTRTSGPVGAPDTIRFQFTARDSE